MLKLKTNSGSHDITEILMKVVLNTINQPILKWPTGLYKNMEVVYNLEV